MDTVECHLTGTCPGRHLSKFSVTFLLLATPLAIVVSVVLYFLYNHISLESQLVDYWWKINYEDIDILATRRKGGTSVPDSTAHGSLVSTQESGPNPASRGTKKTGISSAVAHTTVTKVTEASGAFTSSAVDICYGDINLGIFKLVKVAIKPIGKFHQSRKLMIELRTVSVTDLTVASRKFN